jgi:hypothetical protein
MNQKRSKAADLSSQPAGTGGAEHVGHDRLPPPWRSTGRTGRKVHVTQRYRHDCLYPSSESRFSTTGRKAATTDGTSALAVCARSSQLLDVSTTADEWKASKARKVFQVLGQTPVLSERVQYPSYWGASVGVPQQSACMKIGYGWENARTSCNSRSRRCRATSRRMSRPDSLTQSRLIVKK